MALCMKAAYEEPEVIQARRRRRQSMVAIHMTADSSGQRVVRGSRHRTFHSERAPGRVVGGKAQGLS